MSPRHLGGLAKLALIGAFAGVAIVVLLPGADGTGSGPDTELAPTNPADLALPRPAPPAAPAPLPTAPPAIPRAEPARLRLQPRQVTLEARPGGTARSAVMVVNDGGSTASEVTAQRSGDPALSLASSCGQLLPGQACELQLVYAPAAGAAGGGGQLRVSARDAVPDEGTVTLVVRTPEVVPADPPAPGTDTRAEQRARGRLARAAGYEPGAREPELARHALRAEGAVLDGFGWPNSQKDYGPDFPRAVSSLPVDSCRVIGADDIIEAVLSTTIDSRKCGEVRAVVQRHVYGSAPGCRTVLIPGGSTLVGSCQAMGDHDSRLEVAWRRIIRPDRAHIVIDEIAGDSMGRPGLVGTLDDRMLPRILVTLFGAGVQGGVAGLSAALSQSITTTTTDPVTGRVSTTRTPTGPGGEAAQAAGDAVARSIDRLLTEMIEKRLDTRPVMEVPQGTLITLQPRTDLWLAAPGEQAEARLAPAQRAPGGRQSP